jgi:hypothetical protein
MSINVASSNERVFSVFWHFYTSPFEILCGCGAQYPELGARTTRQKKYVRVSKDSKHHWAMDLTSYKIIVDVCAKVSSFRKFTA